MYPIRPISYSKWVAAGVNKHHGIVAALRQQAAGVFKCYDLLRVSEGKVVIRDRVLKTNLASVLMLGSYDGARRDDRSFSENSEGIGGDVPAGIGWYGITDRCRALHSHLLGRHGRLARARAQSRA
jgi:hypothetical protein